MRKVKDNIISEALQEMVQEANFYLGEDLLEALKKAEKREESPVSKNILKQLQRNAEIAARKKVPVCQDTGYVVVFLEIGREVFIEGDVYTAINRGVRKGYKEGYLRNSIVRDPFDRKNTGDNTPAVIYTEITSGDRIKITVLPKGGGSENMSRVKMLKPADGREGVKEFIVETVKKAGANPCPPLVVGVGIGGTFDKAALLSKKALARNIGSENEDPELAKLEDKWLAEVNKTGVGPQGLGGMITALDLNIETYPCHIASLPVAVNLNCHAARHKERII